MNNIVITVEKRKAKSVTQQLPIVSGNVEADTITATFDSEWDGLDVSATFANAGLAEPTTCVYEDGMPIPHEQTRVAFPLTVSFAGRDNGVLILRTEPIPLEVVYGGGEEGLPDTPATRGIIADCIAATEEARHAAQGPIGPQGPEGPQGPPGPAGEDGRTPTEDELDALISAQMPELATVATTGSYDDLTDAPTIPTVPTNVSSFANDAGYLTLSTLPTYDGTVV